MRNRVSHCFFCKKNLYFFFATNSPAREGFDLYQFNDLEYSSLNLSTICLSKLPTKANPA